MRCPVSTSLIRSLMTDRGTALRIRSIIHRMRSCSIPPFLGDEKVHFYFTSKYAHILRAISYVIKNAPAGADARKTHSSTCRQTKSIQVQKVHARIEHLYFYRKGIKIHILPELLILDFVWHFYYITKFK